MLRRCATILLAAGLLLFLPGASVGVRAQSSASASANKLCFAFLRQGDLWLTCGGKSGPLTVGGRVYGYALSWDGSHLALYKSRSSRTPEADSGKDHETVVVALKEAFATSLSPLQFDVAGLWSSCNRIFATERLPNLAGTRGMYDVVTGNPIRLTDLVGGLTGKSKDDDFASFACSSDRSVVVGILNPEHAPLVPRLLVAEWPASFEISEGVDGYALSPSGAYIAYQRLGANCVAQITGRTIHIDCVRGVRSLGGLSVSNSGEILAEQEDNRPEGCFYTDRQHYHLPSERPGHQAQDACPAIWYWRPGDNDETMVEDLAGTPQWITQEQAALLRKWSLYAAKR